jgi:hypothetical protein
MLKTSSILIVFVMISFWSDASQDGNQHQQSTNIIREKSDNQTQPKTEPQLTLIMERFTWTHTLLYRVEIQPDGKVNFTKTNGRFVDTKIIKKSEVKLENEKMNQLIAEIKTSNFFSLDFAYGYRHKNCLSALSDNDSVKISINLNGKEHTVNHDLGCFDVSFEELKHTTNRKDKIFPQKLYKLENKIDEIVETKRWIGEPKR